MSSQSRALPWARPLAGPSPKEVVLKRSGLLKNAVLERWAPRSPLEAAAAVSKPGPKGAFLKRSALSENVVLEPWATGSSLEASAGNPFLIF